MTRLLALAHLPQHPSRRFWRRMYFLDDDGSPLCDEHAGDDVKLLGVYSSESAAQARIESARLLPGFSDEPDCFQISRDTLDKDEWAEE